MLLDHRHRRSAVLGDRFDILAGGERQAYECVPGAVEARSGSPWRAAPVTRSSLLDRRTAATCGKSLTVRVLPAVFVAFSSPRVRDLLTMMKPFFRSTSPIRSAVHSDGRMPVQNIVTNPCAVLLYNLIVFHARGCVFACVLLTFRIATCV